MREFFDNYWGPLLFISIMIFGILIALCSSDAGNSSTHYVIAQYNANKEVERCWITNDYNTYDDGVTTFKDQNKLTLRESTTDIAVVKIPNEIGKFKSVAETIGIHDVGTCN